MLGLRHAGLRSVVLEEGESLRGARPSALIFVKSFTDSDLTLARSMHADGVSIVADLCDNVFVPGYAADAPMHPASRFTDICALAFAVVVPTEELARRLRARLPSTTRIEVIPDQVESFTQCKSFANTRETNALLNRRLVGHAARSRRPASLAQIARRVAEKVRHWRTATAGAKRASGRKRLIWFGTHGATRYSGFGLQTVEAVVPSLVKVNERVPIELLVISNSRDAFLPLARQLPFPALYRPWGMLSIFDDIAGCDVCLLPNVLDEFSVCKSANRAVLALSLGVPVVATAIPSLEPLKECLILDNWLEGLRIYLVDAARRERDLRRAAEVIERCYSAPAVSARWLQLLSAMPQ